MPEPLNINHADFELRVLAAMESERRSNPQHSDSDEEWAAVLWGYAQSDAEFVHSFLNRLPKGEAPILLPDPRERQEAEQVRDEEEI